MRPVWRVLYRYYGMRSRRAQAAAHRLQKASEKFFRKIKGGM